MWLKTETGAVADVTAEDLQRLVASEDVGVFAQLFASQTRFIQAGMEVAGPRRNAFLREQGCAPWVLQYGYGEAFPQQMFQAAEVVTFEQVRQVFLAFLAGDEAWRRQFTWGELPQLSKPWRRFW
ncbi:MAG TPA: hypothetical protein VMS17_07535 [Gemmataceae bacterium]|nr:hypothetical protein [Gemmataceae bacterium]